MSRASTFVYLPAYFLEIRSCCLTNRLQMSLDNIGIQGEVNKCSLRLDFQDCLGVKRKEYLNSKPFPHISIDDFLPSFLAEAVHDTFPALDDPIWEDKGSHFQVTGGVASKYELGHIGSFPQPIRTAFEEFLFCPKFVDFVSTVTGIPDLHADQELKGGSLIVGLNAVEKSVLLVICIVIQYNNNFAK